MTTDPNACPTCGDHRDGPDADCANCDFDLDTPTDAYDARTTAIDVVIPRSMSFAGDDAAAPLPSESHYECWFCKGQFVEDALIAGYDTFDEQRLACLACNERMQGNWRPHAAPLPSDTPADGLDAAWREAEAALPEGWRPENGGTGINNIQRTERGWIVWAESGHYGRDVRLLDERASEKVGSPVHKLTNVAYAEGTTLPEALRNLALALTKEPRSTREEAE